MNKSVAALVVAALSVGSALPLAGSADGPSALSTLETRVAAALTTKHLPATTQPTLQVNLPSTDFGIPSELEDCTPTDKGVAVPSCAYGDLHAHTTVVLYGNSQAQAWAPSLAALGLADHFRVVPLAKPACGTFLDPAYLGENGVVSSLCERFARWSIHRIIELHPALVVVASTPGIVLRAGTDWHKYVNVPPPSRLVVVTPPKRTAADFARFVTALAPSGARVVLLGDIPISFLSKVHQTTSQCLLAHPTNLRQCDMSVPKSTNAWHRGFELAAARARVPFVNLNSLMCAKGRCPLVVDRVLVHYDYLHVSGDFARLAAPALGDLLAPYLP